MQNFSIFDSLCMPSWNYIVEAATLPEHSACSMLFQTLSWSCWDGTNRVMQDRVVKQVIQLQKDEPWQVQLMQRCRLLPDNERILTGHYFVTILRVTDRSISDLNGKGVCAARWWWLDPLQTGFKREFERASNHWTLDISRVHYSNSSSFDDSTCRGI